MAWGLTCNWDMEILNAALIGKVGPERAAKLMGDYHSENPTILPQHTYVPSAQRVIEHWKGAQSFLPTGQSGQLASKHYDDMIPLWLNGDYHPMLWSREKVEALAEARSRLEP